MKILSIAEFDPAFVLAGHRKALRALGVDYRIGVVDTYWVHEGRGAEYDWIHPLEPEGRDSLIEFARSADVLQFNPAIGQPWSYKDPNPVFRDGEHSSLFDIDWTRFSGRRVSLFHGSRNAQINADTYAAHWRRFGHAIWATTLEYVHRMGATYAPPAVEDLVTAKASYLAPLRTDDDPLSVVQAPTDRGNCHTDEFLGACRQIGAVALLVENTPWIEAMRRKRECNAGFDHLRGAFSVNTVENCMLGLAPLCGLRPEYKAFLVRDGFGRTVTLDALFPFWTAAGFRAELKNLLYHPMEQAGVQQIAREWFLAHYEAAVVGKRLLEKYREVIR